MSVAFASIASFALAQHNGRLGGFSFSAYLSSAELVNFGTQARSLISSIHFTSAFFILFWVIVGFITYNIIFVLKGSVDESVGFMHQLKYVNAQPALMRKQTFLRFLLLFIAIALWVMFALAFSWALLPAALSLISRSIVTGHSPIYVVWGFLVFLGTTHISVLLLRFTLLKARITNDPNV